MQHQSEVGKPTNTARVLSAVVENCDLVVHALKHRPLTEQLVLRPGADHFVLFPSEDSVILDREFLRRCGERDAVFLLMDASWRQARRMLRRVPGVFDLPRVALPEGPPSSWPIRQATSSHQLCTFETVVRLARLAAAEHAAPLEHVFRTLVDAQVENRSNSRRL